ncbi:Phage baseplate assembly protein V [Burkholderia multivorans]
MHAREMAQRIMGTLVRCTVKLVNSGTKMQSLQLGLLSDEPKDAMEHFEPYGYTSRPKAGAEGVAGFFGGDRSHGVVLVVADRRYRLTGLAEGEVAIYTDEGAKIVMKRGRVIDVECDEYRVVTKHYHVTADAYDVTAQAASIDADHASSTCPITAPDVVLDGKSMVGHYHREHDGPPTGGPLS